jgi:Fic family protein
MLKQEIVQYNGRNRVLLIASYDAIIFSMKPPYEITSDILALYGKICESLGRCKTLHLMKPEAKLRRQNRIKTIHSSLAIEGNILDIELVTAILEKAHVVGPEKDIREVQNAITAYADLGTYDHCSNNDFLRAHKVIMDGLIANAGKYRNRQVGIVKGKEVQHIAPSALMVPGLMNDLFGYLKNDNDLLIIKSCVFHYEMEFIHPFEDGNGRIGRLWQTRILMEVNPIFEYVPIEETVKNRQQEYYKALANSDGEGKSTTFIIFMLSAINESLSKMLDSSRAIKIDFEKRAELALDQLKDWFDRKEYMRVNKGISSATASRDLKTMLQSGIVVASGNGRMIRYRKNAGEK